MCSFTLHLYVYSEKLIENISAFILVKLIKLA